MIFEPGDTITTMSSKGVVAVYQITAEGTVVPVDGRLRTTGRTTGLNTDDSIDVLNLTVRSYNLLKREGVTTLGALLAFHTRHGVEGLSDLRNMRQTNLDEILGHVTRLQEGTN